MDTMNDTTKCEQAIERITKTQAKRGLARAKRRLSEAKRGVFQERRDAKLRAERARDGGAL